MLSRLHVDAEPFGEEQHDVWRKHLHVGRQAQGAELALAGLEPRVQRADGDAGTGGQLLSCHCLHIFFISFFVSSRFVVRKCAVF